MHVLIIFLSIVVFFVIALFIWNTVQSKKGNVERIDDIEKDATDGTCCGEHITCEKDSLINTFEEEVEYFDDEELDAYQGTPSDNYSENVVEEFREVLYSMHDEDKPRWIRSLQKRGIEIPNQIKDEIFIFVNQIRSNK